MEEGDQASKDTSTDPPATGGGFGPYRTAGSIQVFDTTTHTLTPLGVNAVKNPLTAALSPDGRTLIVPNVGLTDPGTTVSIIDTATAVTRTVTLVGRPEMAAFPPDGRSAWITTVYPGSVWRVPLGSS